MPLSRKLLIGLTGVAVVAVLMAVAVWAGVVSLPGSNSSTDPSCDQLPNSRAVTDAINARGDLVERIHQLGDGVAVDVGRPCGDQERSLVRVTYRTDEQRRDIDAVLQADGFGVPVLLVRSLAASTTATTGPSTR